MKSKPSWGLWLGCVVVYAVIGGVITAMLHGGFAWNQVRDSLYDGLTGGTITWLFALWKWHKADCGL